MAERILQSTTIRVPIQAYQSADHVSPATGKTIAITISRNGSAYANPSAGATNATEIGSGSYYVDLSTTDTNTPGPLFVLGTASGTDNVNILYFVGGVNVSQINAVSTSPVTTVTANIGTAQPVNFTGTAGSALVQTDITKIKTQTVTATSAVTVNPNVGTTQVILFTNVGGNFYQQVDMEYVVGDSIAADGLAQAGNDYDANGYFNASVIGMGAGVITASSIASGAFVAAVWDGLISGHTTSGTFGGALNSASSAGDPWNTNLPGSYAPGTAGFVVGTALPQVPPGGANGLLRAGGNAATTFASLAVTGTTALGAVTMLGTTIQSLTVSGAVTLSGAVTATNASNDLRVNVKKVNDVALTGTGILGNEWGPA